MLLIKILATGKTMGDIIAAIEEASASIEEENFIGFNSNQDGAYTFFVSGEEDASSDVQVNHRSLESDDAQGVIAKASLCEESPIRVHQLSRGGRCAYCRKELVAVAG